MHPRLRMVVAGSASLSVLLPFAIAELALTRPDDSSSDVMDLLEEDVPALAVAVNPPEDTAERARRFLVEQRGYGRRAWCSSMPRGVQRIGFPGSEATPERLAHDVRVLLRESGD